MLAPKSPAVLVDSAFSDIADNRGASFFVASFFLRLVAVRAVALIGLFPYRPVFPFGRFG